MTNTHVINYKEQFVSGAIFVIGIIFAAGLFGAPAVAHAAATSSWSVGGALDMGTHASSTCGVDGVVLDAQAKHYDTDTNITVGNLLLQVMNRTGGPPAASASGTSLTGEVCYYPDTQYVSIRGTGGANYYDCMDCGYYCVDTGLSCSWKGKRVRSDIRFRPKSLGGYDVRHVSPIGLAANAPWVNREEFTIELANYPATIGVGTPPNAVEPVESVWVSVDGAEAVRYGVTQWARSGSNYTVTLPYPSSRANGLHYWGFKFRLNGSTLLSSTVPVSNSPGWEYYNLDQENPIASVAHTPLSPTYLQTVTFTATVQDLHSGLLWAEIYVNGSMVKRCDYTGTTAEQTCVSGASGPYTEGVFHSYYVVARDRAGNERQSAPRTFVVGGRADLYVSSLTIAGIMEEGELITFDARVQNGGGVDADSHYFRFCIDNPDCLTTTTGEIGSARIANTPPSSYDPVTDTWTAVLGPHTITLCADVQTGVDESNETNNCYTLPMNITPPGTGTTGPDLIASGLYRTPSGTIVEGDVVNFGGRVVNAGDASTGATSYARYCIDNTTCLDPSTTGRLGNDQRTSILNPGETEWLSQVAWTSTGIGSHTLTLCADARLTIAETNETNNCTTLAFTVSDPAIVTTNLPDLYPYYWSTPSYNFYDGDQVTFYATICNSGWVGAPQSKTRFCIDNPSCYGANTTGRIGRDADAPAVPASYPTYGGYCISGGGNRTDQPWTATEGIHTITHCFDAPASIDERNEGNNCKTVSFTVQPPATPDIVSTNLSRSAGTIIAGQTVTFSGNAQNVGDRTGGGGYARFCIDETRCEQSNRNAIGGVGNDKYFGSLSPGATSATFTQDWVTTAGSHILTLCVDVNDNVVESNPTGTGETNNCANYAFTVLSLPPDINVPLTSQADLIVPTLTRSPAGTILANDLVTFSGTVRNQGGISAPASYARFCINNANCLTSTVGRLGVDQAVPILASGATSPSYTSSAWTAVNGAHTLTLCADVTDVVPEYGGTGEANNCQTIPVVVGVLPSGTLTPSAYSCIIPAGASTCTVTMTWETENTLTPNLFDRNVGATLSTPAMHPTRWPDNATAFTVWVSNPGTTFDLREGTSNLDTDYISGSCAPGSTWSGTVCLADVSIISFTSAPANPIPYNTAPTLSWTGVTGGGTITCSIDQGVGVVVPPGTIPDGSRAAGNLTTDTTFTITCGNGVGPNATRQTTVTIAAPPPILRVDPAQQGYGNVAVGYTDTRDFLVTNDGSPTSILRGIAVSSDPAHFTCVAGCDYSGSGLAGGSSQTVSIRFAPSVLGLHQAQITFTGAGATPPVLDRDVFGTGVLPITGNPLNFGAVLINRDKTLVLTINNNGAATLTDRVRLPFAVYTCEPSCDVSIASGGSQSITIRFAPLLVQTYNGNAFLEMNPTVIFPITGSGVSGYLRFFDR